jgi:hypothetical protein
MILRVSDVVSSAVRSLFLLVAGAQGGDRRGKDPLKYGATRGLAVSLTPLHTVLHLCPSMYVLLCMHVALFLFCGDQLRMS